MKVGVLLAATAIGAACASGTHSDASDTGSAGSGGSAGSAGSAGDQGFAGDQSSGGTESGAGGQSTGGKGVAGFPSGAGGTSGKGGAPGNGMFGATCSSSADCASGDCIDTSNGGAPDKVCAQPCVTGSSCPTNAHCTVVGSTPQCIPDGQSPCAVCNKDSDCKNIGDVCGESSDGERFCAEDCSQDGACPKGLTCQSVMGGTKMVKACAPPMLGACPCAANRDGAAKPCTATSMGLTCNGTQTCDGKTAMFGACNAPAPMPETCNGKDDDCNGKVDDVPNTMCNCMASGTCSPICDMGFAHYPATSSGCTCAVDAKEAGACASAVDLGNIIDTGGTGDATVSGTLAGDSEIDWIKVNVQDAMETGLNSYHVKISFDTNPGMEFAFLVARGGDCSKATTVLTSYDFCVNYSDSANMKGEAPCGMADGLPHCEDLSSEYVIGVTRQVGIATKTCSSYKLHIVAGAGTCDTSSIDGCAG